MFSAAINAPLLATLAFTISACNQACSPDRAIALARQKAASLSWEIEGASLRAQNRGQFWQVEFYRPEVGTEGQYVFSIEKQRCAVVNQIGFQ